MQVKVCTRCRAEKSVDEFHRAKLGKFGRKSICKPCNLDEFRQYRLEHPEKRQTTQKNYETKYRDAIKVKRDALAEKNRKKALDWAAKNRERSRRKTSEWIRANPERHRANCLARELARGQATPNWADRPTMRAFYELARAKTEQTGIPHEVDHIVPIRSRLVCGLHCQANLQVLTKAENRAKRNSRWPDKP